MFQVSCGDDRFSLLARICPVGDDLLLLVTGGSRIHIGALALAGSGGTAVETLCLPGHREDEPARDLAAQVGAATGRTVAVAAGMHWDGLESADIDGIRRLWRRLGFDIIAAIRRQGEW
jgi:hypothetical protein